MLENKNNAELELDFYRRLYKLDSLTKFFFSFNFCVFFFGPLWFCYKRMLGMGIALYLFISILSFAICCSPLVPAFFDEIHLWLLFIFMDALIAIFANWIYVQHLTKNLQKYNLRKVSSFGCLLVGFLIMTGIWGCNIFVTLNKLEPYKKKQIESILSKDSALSIACYKRIIKKGIYDIEERNELGETVAFIAAKKNLVRQLTYFSEIGANLEAENNKGMRPIDVAVALGHISIVKLLIEQQVDFQSEQLQATPLIVAAYQGDLDMVKLLVTHGANVNYAQGHGFTALDAALDRGNTDIANYLKEYSHGKQASS